MKKIHVCEVRRLAIKSGGSIDCEALADDYLATATPNCTGDYQLSRPVPLYWGRWIIHVIMADLKVAAAPTSNEGACKSPFSTRQLAAGGHRMARPARFRLR